YILSALHDVSACYLDFAHHHDHDTDHLDLDGLSAWIQSSIAKQPRFFRGARTGRAGRDCGHGHRRAGDNAVLVRNGTGQSAASGLLSKGADRARETDQNHHTGQSPYVRTLPSVHLRLPLSRSMTAGSRHTYSDHGEAIPNG